MYSNPTDFSWATQLLIPVHDYLKNFHAKLATIIAISVLARHLISSHTATFSKFRVLRYWWQYQQVGRIISYATVTITRSHCRGSIISIVQGCFCYTYGYFTRNVMMYEWTPKSCTIICQWLFLVAQHKSWGPHSQPTGSVKPRKVWRNLRSWDAVWWIKMLYHDNHRHWTQSTRMHTQYNQVL